MSPLGLSDAQRGVIWDLDGVLADTAEAHFRSWKETLAWWNIPFDRVAFDRVFGMNNRDSLTELLGRDPEPQELTEIGELKEDLFRREAKHHVKAGPGAVRLLEELEQNGWWQALASSAPQANIDLLLDLLSIRERFCVIRSGEALPAGKPDPTLFLETAEAMGLPPGRCVVVEDAPPGVEAARRAGMGCIAVATTRSREALQADRVFDDLTHVTVADFANLMDET
jgi:HAD superfamily hydrolase (TIGR01509 family)